MVRHRRVTKVSVISLVFAFCGSYITKLTVRCLPVWDSDTRSIAIPGTDRPNIYVRRGAILESRYQEFSAAETTTTVHCTVLLAKDGKRSRKTGFRSPFFPVRGSTNALLVLLDRLGDRWVGRGVGRELVSRTDVDDVDDVDDVEGGTSVHILMYCNCI